MDIGLFKKIIDEATSISLISGYVLTGLGEPTLDPKLVERVSYIKGLAPGHEVGIYTNGFTMRPDLFDRLKEAKLDTVIFSLNATDADQHASVMGVPGKYEMVCANIDYARANRGKVRIEVRAVFLPLTWTDRRKQSFMQRWGDGSKGGDAWLVYEGNWAGENRTMVAFEPNECCPRAVRQIYVMFDGRVATCCFDPTGKQVFGDLKTQTLREVYASDAYVAFREAHAKNLADTYEICKGCTRI